MRNTLVAIAGALLLALLAEAVVLAFLPVDRVKLGAFFASLALLLLAFVGLTYTAVVRAIRHLAVTSAVSALALPFLLLVPYLVYSLGTDSFSAEGLGKLAAYIAVPTLLLFPDRRGHGERLGWRDVAAMLALGVPVSARWLRGIWTWPEEVYFFGPLFCVAVGAYGFLVLRRLEDVGYRLGFRKYDVIDGFINFAGFAALGIPLGYALGFIAFRPTSVSFLDFVVQFAGIYLTIAIPEELLFRGIFQNQLQKTFSGRRRGVYALLVASVVFGLAHLHHAPVPNWRYAVMAALAGGFYGNAFRMRRRISSAALTHTLVDAVWHFWF
jgi:hypothetical protein